MAAIGGMPATPALAADRKKVVVCDNGTGFVKCGFAGDLWPAAVFPCVVGRPASPGQGKQQARKRFSIHQTCLLLYLIPAHTELVKQEALVGDACVEGRDTKLSYPIDNGKPPLLPPHFVQG